MAQLPIVTLKRSGNINPAYQAASAGGDRVAPNPDLFLHIKNGAGVAQTVTVATPGKTAGLDIADAVVAIPAAGAAFIGPIDGKVFADPVTGQAHISYSAVASLTIAAVQLDRA